MNSTEKEIFYKTSNTYSTMNLLNQETKYIWFVCHGMGYLSRYFIKHFKGLSEIENYVISPQAQSKYYQSSNFKHVGSSWLTKENTVPETENVMRYFDTIFETENIPNEKKLICLGYSQGVSVIMRYIAKRKLNCEHLVIHSGGIPKELEITDFSHFTGQVSLVYGTQDEYLTEERIAYETSRAKELFGDQLNIIPFDGQHEVNETIIKSIV